MDFQELQQKALLNLPVKEAKKAIELINRIEIRYNEKPIN